MPQTGVVAHKGGFEEEEIRSVFNATGLQDVTFDKVTSARKNGFSVDFFLARGVKPLW